LQETAMGTAAWEDRVMEQGAAVPDQGATRWSSRVVMNRTGAATNSAMKRAVKSLVLASLGPSWARMKKAVNPWLSSTWEMTGSTPRQSMIVSLWKGLR